MDHSTTTISTIGLGVDVEGNKSQRGERGMFEVTKFRASIGMDIVNESWMVGSLLQCHTPSEECCANLLEQMKAGIEAIPLDLVFKVYANDKAQEISGSLLREAARLTFGNRDGELVEPVLGLFDGNNRIGSLVIANAILLSQGKDYDDLIHEVPAVVYEGELDPEVRKDLASAANHGVGQEAVPFHRDVVNFYDAAIVRGYGKNPAFRQIFRKDPNDFTADRMRFSTICNFINACPDALEIFERGDIKAGASAYHHAAVSKMLKPDDKGFYLTGKTKKPTKKEMLAFIIDPKGFQDGTKKDRKDPITPKQLANIITGSQNSVKKALLDNYRDGDREALAKFEEPVTVKAFNALHYLTNHGFGAEAVEVLEKLLKDKKLEEYFARDEGSEEAAE